jgi:hypothetical protein
MHKLNKTSFFSGIFSIFVAGMKNRKELILEKKQVEITKYHRKESLFKK